jgi:arylsulfatase A-like enzyme
MQKIGVLFLLLYVFFQANTSYSAQESDIDLSCANCNVIFLDIDLLRADFGGGEKYPNNMNTPNINKFFKDSLIFDDVMSVSGVTAISNTATLSAMNGHFTYGLLRNTFVDKPPQMPDRYLKMYQSRPIISEVLKRNGYDTANINHGWYAGKQMLLNRGVDFYWGTGEANSTTNVPGAAIEQAAKYISSRRGKTKQFFMLLRSEDLRGFPYRYPINAPRIEDPRVQYKGGDDSFVEVRYQIGSEGKIKDGYSSFEMAGWMNESQLAEYQSLGKALYARQLTFVDEKLKLIFNSLDRSNLIDKSIVVLYSNHGDGLYDNKVPNHGVSYQSCVSVPLMIRHPRVKRPITIDSPIALTDLVPTIYEMVGVKAPKTIDGASFIPQIRGEEPPKDFYFGVDKQSQYVRYKNMKLIVWADRNKELYDLKSDPNELNNIILGNQDLATSLDNLLSERDMEGLSSAIDLINSFKLDRVPRD